MPNFFTDNADLMTQLEHIGLEEVVSILEDDYAQASEFDYAPTDYADAMENYRKVLTSLGSICGDSIAPRAAGVDLEGSSLDGGEVTYAEGTRESLRQLAQAELMGVTLPRRYGGLNFPTTVYTMTVELISRADASLMNLYGLQDIAETILKFGGEALREEFLPGLAGGKHTGAMALTEPGAGSDLQVVKLEAKQGEGGAWTLKGVKHFITNGCGDVLLVLARSEPGTKDARGLSLFVCRGDETVEVRRIEDKLGIHGSPTCELQFNDTPAWLIGKRRFGLIRYVMSLMNGARLGVSAQAMGISQAAYTQALRFAKTREQFGKPICEIPPVANMLIDMRVTLESNRALLYSAAKWVDLRERLEERVEKLKAAKAPFKEEKRRAKEAAQIAGLLTPLTKYSLAEAANKITYDALQIHGGVGYMKDFEIERLVRDARITNIYEGTSQLQIVAAIGGVTKDVLSGHFDAKAQEAYGELTPLAEDLRAIRQLFLETRRYVEEAEDHALAEVAAKALVEMYGFVHVGYLLLDAAQGDPHKALIARRYIKGALAAAQVSLTSIQGGLFSDLSQAQEILV